MSIIGIGTDIVECLRIAQMIERHGELFITRVYTPHEIEYCQSRRLGTQHFAGRWAAKEAVLKALGTGWRRGISWRDVEIRNLQSGSPSVALYGGARDLHGAKRHRADSDQHLALPQPRHGVCDRAARREVARNPSNRD